MSEDFRAEIRRDQKAREIARRILGVGENASDQELKTAWRQRCKKYHPDRNPGEEGARKKFLVINCAYQFLTDSEPCEDLLLAAEDGLSKSDNGEESPENQWAFFLWWRDKFF